MGNTSKTRPSTCPSWCVRRHGEHVGEDDHVHVGGQLVVRHTLLRLCMTVDPETGVQDGPYVLVGANEYTLHEADVLIAALTQLVDQGQAEPAPPSVPQMRTGRSGQGPFRDLNRSLERGQTGA